MGWEGDYAKVSTKSRSYEFVRSHRLWGSQLSVIKSIQLSYSFVCHLFSVCDLSFFSYMRYKTHADAQASLEKLKGEAG